jgi:hypothetical protein
MPLVLPVKHDGISRLKKKQGLSQLEQLVPHWVLNVLPASSVHLQVLRVPCRKNHSDFPTLISGLVDRYVQRGRFRNDKVGRSYYFLVPVPGNLFVGCSVGPEWTGSMDCQKLVRFSRGWGFEVGLNFEERWQGQAVCQRLSAFVSVCLLSRFCFNTCLPELLN